ncbi:MAG: c-type cytochrome domain-containing protein, partial [Pirellulales bacterium]
MVNRFLAGVVVSLTFSIAVYSDEISHGSKPVELVSHAVVLDTEVLSGFFSEHCIRCHGADEQNGEMRFDTLSLKITDSDTALHWQEVLDVLNLGEMPPEDEPVPTDEQLQKVLAHLTEALTESKKRLSETGGDVVLRRMNRREYKYTIDQLFGLRVP